MIPINELLHYLGASDGDDDILLEMERNAVSFTETQTGRYFGPPQEFEEILNGNGSRKLWLSEAPIEPVTDPEYPSTILPMAVVGEGRLGEDPVTVEDFSVRLIGAVATPDRAGVLIRTGGNCWRNGLEYTVGYTRGYPAGEEPGTIRQFVLDLLAIKWRIRSEDGEAFRSEIMAGYSYTRFGNSDIDAISGGWATIEAWKRLVYA